MAGEAVVAGVDGTAVSERAALWAARQAAAFDLPLVLVHGLRWPVQPQAYPNMPLDIGAVDPVAVEEPARQWAREVLDGLARRCGEATGVEVRTEVLTGDPANAVVLAADRAALVAVGHARHGGVARFLLGSTAERLTRSCPWPVVVVREEASADERRDRGPVVVGVDGSAVGDQAVRFAFRFAAGHGSEVVVVHASVDAVDAVGVVEGRPPRDAVGEGALRDGVDVAGESALRDRWGAALAECARQYPGAARRLVVAAGPPADALLAASAEASLLVVGSRGRGAVRRALLGSVSHEVVEGAPCPVAVLPPGTVR
ncbi:universal stress protein [Saccharothrix xinjiangensis]